MAVINNRRDIQTGHFLRGIGSVLNLGCTPKYIMPSARGFEADAKALQGDAVRVGRDMQKALNQEWQKLSFELVKSSEFSQGTRIKVIGLGGGGGNAVEHMIQKGVKGVEFICANTDAQALKRSSANQIVLLGTTGLGIGSRPERGRAAAELSIENIKAAIDGAHMLFITAGMGGGTGTGSASIVARIAKEMGILTVGIVTTPFDFEGARRRANAEAGLIELEANVDSLIVVQNDKILDILGDDISEEEAFDYANDVLKNAVDAIVEIINQPNLAVDFLDVQTVMSEKGKAMIGIGIAAGENRARAAAEQATTSPLWPNLSMSDAKSLLVQIAANKGSLKLSEAKLAMNVIRGYASPDAHVIYDTRIDDSLKESIRITVIATGMTSNSQRTDKSTLDMFRTGTDD
jgi:cell division protein FtsZ